MKNKALYRAKARRFRLNIVAAITVTALMIASYYIVSPPTAQGISASIVISQVYGGGGNAGSTFRNDFIELFNLGNTTINVTGWSVQYTSTAGTTWQVTTLSGSIAPGQYYLAQEAAGAGGTVNLPAPDATGGINMSATGGKVALVNNSTALSGACPTGANIVDFVGYDGANCFEGTATPTLSNTTAALRNSNGCVDTDNNGADFTVGAPNPRNTASPTNTCGAPTNPSGVGAANPNTVTQGGATLLTVTVTPGANPISTGINVTGDLTSIGGSTTQQFFDDGTNGDAAINDNIFSFQATVALSATPGAKSLPISITDAQTRAATTSISLTVQAPTVPAGSVVISQVYGGGGNSGATLKNDFVELFNRTANPINITGWSVQYTSANGTSWQVTPLSGTIDPGRYYLAQEAQGAGGTINLPAPDAIGTIAMAAGSGKVALVTNSTALSGACPTGANISDFVGYDGANCFEGAGAAPTLSNTTAALRALNGCQDTDNNAADFSSGTPNPRNSASPFTDCNAPPPPPLAINQIQGNGAASPFAGQLVTTNLSIVTGLKSNGFFIQTPEGAEDNDPTTSEGLFVFTGSPRPASPVIGDAVAVRGIVAEFIPSQDPNSPPITELSGSINTTVLSSGNPLPAPIALTAADTSPSGSIEQLEKFEGMRVHVDSLTVIAPTDGSTNESTATSSSDGVFYGVITGIARPFREPGIQVPDPLPAGSPCCVPRFDANPERLRIDSNAQPGTAVINVTTGATVTNLTGPLDYSFRTYTILPDLATPPSATGNISAIPVSIPGADQFTVASFNMERFFDTVDDPGISDVALTPTAFNNRLNKASLAIRNVMRAPDIIGIEEMENLTTLQAVATKVNNDAIAAGQPNPSYQAYLVEGNDIGGIDVGFLVKSNRVNVIDVTQEGKDATYINPNNGQPELLNDRPSLVMRATILTPAGTPFPVTVIVNHLRSLSGVDDPADGNRVRAKRQAQAEFLANLIQTRQTLNPAERIISVGDYNAFQFSDGLVDMIGTIKGTPAPANEVVRASSDLVNPDLVDLVDLAPADQRYSFSFDGNAQELDHILITQNVLSIFSSLNYARNDTDFPEVFRSDATRPERISDHDMPVAYFTFPSADLSIVKSASSASAQTGSQFSYTITVTNNGAGAAADVVVTDNLPAEVTFVTCNSTGGGVCAGAGNNRTVNFNSLAGGSSVVITITVNLNCGVRNGASISNTATVSSSTPDPNSNNNSSSANVTASNPPPQITCPANVLATAALGQSSTLVTYPSPAVTDNCAGVSVACMPPSGSAFPLGVTTVTCSATDSSGSQNACSFKVAVSGTLLASADSFLRDGAEDTNEGANERLRVQNAGNNRAVVRFNLSGIPAAGLQSATLMLNIAENLNNWGSTGRPVDARRLLVDWTEGNGRNDVMVAGRPFFRGTGEGVTWNCAKDSDIHNLRNDCAASWNGGTAAAATAPAILHKNNMTGPVSWNVTADVQAGANFGWLIKKQSETQNGQVRYYSREGAALVGNANLAPRLVLVYLP